jgi:hypothetical protein
MFFIRLMSKPYRVSGTAILGLLPGFLSEVTIILTREPSGTYAPITLCLFSPESLSPLIFLKGMTTLAGVMSPSLFFLGLGVFIDRLTYSLRAYLLIVLTLPVPILSGSAPWPWFRPGVLFLLGVLPLLGVEFRIFMLTAGLRVSGKAATFTT